MEPSAALAFHNPGETFDKKITIEDLIQFVKDNNLLDSSVNQYVHVQASASSSWTINHNLETDQVIVVVYDNSAPSNYIFPNSIDAFTNSCTLDF